MFHEIVFILALIAIGDAITFDKQINIRSESDPINRTKQNLLSTLMVLLDNGSDKPDKHKSELTSSQIDEPNDYKKSVRNLVSQKSSLLYSFGPMLLESIYNEAFKTGDELVRYKIDSITDASQKFVSGVKTAGKLAVGLAVKAVKQVTKGVTVIKGIILKPAFFVVGSQMKLLGSGLKVLGSGTQYVGTAIKDAGKAIKAVPLGLVGFGATYINSNVDNVDNEDDYPKLQVTPQPELVKSDNPKLKTTPQQELVKSVNPKLQATPPPKLVESSTILNSTQPLDKKPNPTLSAPKLPNFY